MRSRAGLLPAGSLVFVGALALALALAGSGPAGDGRGPARSTFSLEQARTFDEFPLYNAGDRVEGLPLVSVLRRNDTASYVSFVYGDCVASDDAGCAPPVEIQVWPACRRNLELYDSAQAGGPLPERVVTRGVPAAFFEEGTRLELQTGRSTVVVFAESRVRALRIAAALRAVNAPVPAGEPLPPPTRGASGDAMGC
ncbi:MAG: hypothetical protein ACRDNY_03990 [Gaiellaceae bacterium]